MEKVRTPRGLEVQVYDVGLVEIENPALPSCIGVEITPLGPDDHTSVEGAIYRIAVYDASENGMKTMRSEYGIAWVMRDGRIFKNTDWR